MFDLYDSHDEVPSLANVHQNTYTYWQYNPVKFNTYTKLCLFFNSGRSAY